MVVDVCIPTISIKIHRKKFKEIKNMKKSENQI